ncbi:MAG: vanadium-dependent haloperoxidase [Terracidiphilus sp.]
MRLFTCIFVVVIALVPPNSGAQSRSKIVLQWNAVEIQAIRDSNLGAPMASRALAIVNTCMYDAWAAYDTRAVGTQLAGALRRPLLERTPANKEKTISYAAYRALTDLLPGNTSSLYKPLMKQLGYDPNDHSTDIETPAGIGNVACGAVLEFRHHDKSNQLGDMDSAAQANALSAGIKMSAASPYADWSGYRSLNAPTPVPARFPLIKPLNPDHWQPLTYTDGTGSLVLQMFDGAQWCYVTPFAMSKGDQFRALLEPGPPKYGTIEYQREAQELIELSATLNDRQKMIAEYWSDGPNTEQPPGHWIRLAQWVSERDHHTLDDNVKMFFALGNALFDASIAAWDAKRTDDSIRPVTAIELLYRGKTIRGWGGPGKGTVEMDGSKWIPYQPKTFPTPPSPEYPSARCTYAATAARILTLWTGSDNFGYSVTLPAGSSKIEPGVTPARHVTLKWETFTQAADQAGMSGRYAGIDFVSADMAGRKLGRLVGDATWSKAQSYFDGKAFAATSMTGNAPAQ